MKCCGPIPHDAAVAAGKTLPTGGDVFLAVTSVSCGISFEKVHVAGESGELPAALPVSKIAAPVPLRSS